jgi:hypothetical protein
LINFYPDYRRLANSPLLRTPECKMSPRCLFISVSHSFSESLSAIFFYLFLFSSSISFYFFLFLYPFFCFDFSIPSFLIPPFSRSLLSFAFFSFYFLFFLPFFFSFFLIFFILSSFLFAHVRIASANKSMLASFLSILSVFLLSVLQEKAVPVY